MAEHVFLRMSGAPDEATLVAFDGEGRLLAGPETLPLAEAAERAADRPVTVLLPARDLVTCVVNVPAASPARLGQMLPFSLEDDFAGDIDDLHFAPGARNDAQLLAVSVIEKDRFAFWLEALKTSGVQARRICSEADGVLDTPGVVTLFVEGRQILGRRPGGAPFAFDELDLDELWQLLEAEREDKDDLDNAVLFIDSATLDERRAEIDAWRHKVEHLDIKELRDGCLPRLAAGLVLRPGTNLLQGSYAPRSNYAALARPWRVAAGLVLAVLLFGLLGKGAEYFKLRQDSGRLDAEISSICAERFGSRQLAACRLEMQRRLERNGQQSASARGGLLAALAVVADAAGNAMNIDSIDFRDDVLTLQAGVPSVDFLNVFTQGVTDHGGFEVRTESIKNDANTDAKQVRLRIVPATP